MDRPGTRNVWSQLSGGVEIDGQIAATWWHSTSRRRRSSEIRRPGINISIKECVYLALANSSVAKLLAKRRWSQQKIPVLLEPLPHLNFFKTFEQCRDIQEVLSLILHCKTTYCCHTASSSTSITLGRNAHDLHSIIQSGLIPAGRSLKRGQAVRAFSQQCRIKIWKKFNTIWINPGLQCTVILGKFIKLPFFCVIWRVLREEDCSSIKHDPTQSLCSTQYLRYASRKWKTCWLERIQTAKYINPQGYRASYSRRICIMDVRIFLIPKREHPADHQSE